MSAAGEPTLFGEELGLRPGWSARAVVRVDVVPELYRALGPLAARHGKTITPFINLILAEYLAGHEPAVAAALPLLDALGEGEPEA